jgi:hypothetical protein
VELLTYLLTGAIAGLMAGLLGIGGGLVIVPALAWLFAGRGFADAGLMHYAVGTSLATIVATSISSLLAHHRRGSVHWAAVRALTPGILVGALGGAWLARYISSPVLSGVFGVFEMLVALQLLAGARPVAHRTLPGSGALAGAGVVIGCVSALLGIGGGTLTVPFLLWNRIDIRPCRCRRVCHRRPPCRHAARCEYRFYLLAGRGGYRLGQYPAGAAGGAPGASPAAPAAAAGIRPDAGTDRTENDYRGQRLANGLKSPCLGWGKRLIILIYSVIIQIRKSLINN